MRLGHTVEVVGSRMFVLGGGRMYDNLGFFCFDIRKQEWRKLEATDFSSHGENITYHSTALVEDKLLLLGKTRFSTSNKLWKFDMVLEQFTSCDCNSDSIIASHSMVFEYIEHRKECIQFGGRTSRGRATSELNALRLTETEWYKPIVKGDSPPAFCNMASCVQGTTIYTFGGHSFASALDDLRLLHCAGHGAVTWSTPNVRGVKPPGRYDATLTNLHGGNLLMVGGFRVGLLDDMWLFSVVESRWIQLETKQSVRGRIPEVAEHAAAYFGNVLIIVGGHGSESHNGFLMLKGA